MEEPTVFKKIILPALLILSFGTQARAETPHQDYTQMEFKDCNGCHQSSDVAPNHGAMWAKEHRLYAEKQPNNCAACHQQSFCLDCHTGGGIDRDLHASTSGADYMPKSHRTDFREIHPIKAFDDARSCFRCHDQKRFCVACHEKFNPNDLRFLSHRKGFSDIEVSAGGPQHSVFTPSQCQTCHLNSVLPIHRWTNSHAREARRNLSSCQSCHADGETCLKCHSAVSGLKVNPHPKNWGKIADRLKQYGDNKSCIRCHS
jgi:hypothetical protein